MKDKPVWKPITDPALALQIQARKWKEDHPTWIVRDGVTWVLKESIGKRL